MKGSIQDEGITCINIYACNIGTPKYIKQILTYTKGETDNNAIIVEDFNTHWPQWTDHPDIKSIWQRRS